MNWSGPTILSSIFTQMYVSPNGASWGIFAVTVSPVQSRAPMLICFSDGPSSTPAFSGTKPTLSTGGFGVPIVERIGRLASGADSPVIKFVPCSLITVPGGA